MPVNKDVLGAALVGVVIGGVVAALLDIVTLPLSNAVGAFIGGAIAAYILNGKIPQATRAGALSGIFGMPFYLGVAQVLYVFGAYPLQTTTPPMSQLQLEVGIIFLMNLALGTAGGFFVGAVRHPPTETQTLQPTPPGSTPGQLRYCVQCGAKLPAGTVICPHCNARQPT